MIELRDNQLVVSFPDVHKGATATIEFQRTLRIPDDDGTYPLPPGLGRFPLRQVDDYSEQVPPRWMSHGGVMLPMYQSEALWIDLDGDYPFAIRVATGRIDAVTGEELSQGLRQDPQNYLVIPGQPWLDGYCVEKGVIRQFVAMPLGSGYTAEEQVTGEATHGGLQLEVFPMREADYLRLGLDKDDGEFGRAVFTKELAMGVASSDMGLAPGGRMRQEIYQDRFGVDVWDTKHTARCFVHIANSLIWRQVTGEQPPTVPPTAKEYSKAGLPWFEYYDENLAAVEGSSILAKLKSVVQLGKRKGDVPLPENASVFPAHVLQLRKGLRKDQVREGTF